MALTKLKSSGIADGAVTADGLAAGSITAADIAANSITVAQMSRAGTSGQVLTSAGTGADASWAAAAAGNNTPMFSAYLSADQNIADATNVKVQFNTITITDGGTYDNSTNYRWTPGVVGKYVIKTSLGLYHVGGNHTDMQVAKVRFYINGSEPSPGFQFDNYYGYSQNTMPGWVHLQSDAVISMNATDYLEVYAHINHTWTANQNFIAGNQASYFSAFKLIGS